MRTLPHWGHLLPLLGATFAYYFGLGWLKQARREANEGDCGQAPRPANRPTYAELPTEEWCPAHDLWYGPETECPGCREEWEQAWTLGEEPEEQERRDDFNDQAEERAAAEAELPWPSPAEIAHHDAMETDGWYQDLIRRASTPGHDPHNGWRV